MIVLLPKTDGGLWPIGANAIYIRVWMRCRRNHIASWRAANQQPYLYGGKARGAQRAAWMQAARAEAAKLTRQAYGMALLDIVNTFEKSRTSIFSRPLKNTDTASGPSGSHSLGTV